MIIDCHGHFTTTPPAVGAWRERQLEGLAAGDGNLSRPSVSDDDLREAVVGAQLAMQSARGIDLTLFSPRASWMGHHVGTASTSRAWTELQNDLVARVCELFPSNFAPVAQLPQSPGAPIEDSVRELRRCVEELGFVGCNVNPDPSGGSFDGPPLFDRYWWPLWETLEELDVPAMVHVSAAANRSFHTTGSYYLSADTVAFVQALSSGFLADHPGLRLVIPHGGGAVPFHWGRFRGMAADQGWDFDATMSQLWFDTCVYHQPGIDLLVSVVPSDRLLFGSEMIGAVRGTDPSTGHRWDDTGRYVDAAALTDEARVAVYAENALLVYPRLRTRLRATATAGAPS